MLYLTFIHSNIRRRHIFTTKPSASSTRTICISAIIFLGAMRWFNNPTAKSVRSSSFSPRYSVTLASIHPRMIFSTKSCFLTRSHSIGYFSRSELSFGMNATNSFAVFGVSFFLRLGDSLCSLSRRTFEESLCSLSRLPFDESLCSLSRSDLKSLSRRS